jgi:hypothetical protein
LFEVGFKKHNMGDNWPNHYQVKAMEVTLLLYGRMSINGEEIGSMSILKCDPGVAIKPKFLTDCWCVVVKLPSIPTDKKVVKNGDRIPNSGQRLKVFERWLCAAETFCRGWWKKND